jgi:hypothetical protein
VLFLLHVLCIEATFSTCQPPTWVCHEGFTNGAAFFYLNPSSLYFPRFIGDDPFNPMELASERWRPILGVEAIVISVISMLCDPNIESPANIDAGVLFRDNREEFKRKCRQCVRASQDA